MASLRENQDLREFLLENVQQTEEDRILGTGSYGTVEEVQLVIDRSLLSSARHIQLQSSMFRIIDSRLLSLFQ